MQQLTSTASVAETLEYALSVAPIITAAYAITIFEDGLLKVQGNRSETSNVPTELGLERCGDDDFDDGAHRFEHWIGKGHGRRANVTVEYIAVSPAEAPAAVTA
jgi:hypothetical protein